MSSVDYKKIKEEWVEKGQAPEWVSTNAVQFFSQKYAYKGETWLSRITGVADFLAEHAPSVYPDWWEEDEYTKGKTYAEVFLQLRLDGFTIDSTPLFTNAGIKERGMTISCSGQTVFNSIADKSFNRAELEQLVKNGHGCAWTIPDWLSEGTLYSDDGNRSAGIIPVIEEARLEVEKINQSKRRGVVAFNVNIEHGDFWEVASYLYKNHVKLNLGWVIKDAFIKKLFSGDIEALKRFSRIVQIRMQTGKGYFIKIDTMNRNKADVFKELCLEVFGSNLCVAPETMLLTDKGYFPIADLEDEKVNVWNGVEYSEVEVKKTGVNKKLIKVVTDSGQEIECTPYHKFYRQNAYGKQSEKVEARSLKTGDKLIKMVTPVVDGGKTLKHAYTNGFFSGDGCEHAGRPFISLYGDKRDLIGIFTGVKRTYHEDYRVNIYLKKEEFERKFFVPTSDFTVESRLDWFAGLLDSDGTVSRNGINESLQVGSIHKNFLKEVQLMLQTLGVQSKVKQNQDAGYRMMPKNDGTGEYAEYWCNESYRLLVNSNGLWALTKLGLKTNRLKWEKRLPQRDAEQFSKVVSVIDEGRVDDTYCFNEPKRHMGVFNGLLTGNCTEVSLPANEEYSFTCPIINTNLTMYRSFPKHMHHLTMIMQDANVTAYLKQIEEKKGTSRLFLDKVYKFTSHFRAVGCGTAGFHSLLMQEGIIYGSFESELLNEEIYSQMRKDTYECSEWLAKVCGVPDGLKKAGINRRNATTMFSPPTKSSAELARNTPSEGVMLQTALIKMKEVTGSDIFRIEPAFLALMKKKGIYTQELVKDITENNGSIQHLDCFTEHEKKVFRTAFEIDQITHLNMCASRQRFFDQQQSINIYLCSSDSEEYIRHVHLTALLMEGINALYYCQSNRGGKFKREIEECLQCQ